MSLLVPLSKDRQFTERNLANWKDITATWITSDLSQRTELLPYLRSELGPSLKVYFNATPNLRVADIGCGDAWLLELLREHDFRGHYQGLDSNPGFISHLKKKYSGQKNTIFTLHDFSNEALPFDVRFDVVVCSFSLFEVAELDQAIERIAKVIKPGGFLVIITINALSQLLAISKDDDEFLVNLKTYQEHGSECCYEKMIDSGKDTLEQKYFGILHSAAHYIALCHQNGFQLQSYRELNLMGSPIPKIYELLVFHR